jgi:predicted RNase H-like HicB family nuclease
MTRLCFFYILEDVRFPMTYRVVLQQSEEGYSVSCPGLPGCWSQGETEQEALENIKSAIHDYLVVVEELTRGQEVREVEVLDS